MLSAAATPTRSAEPQPTHGPARHDPCRSARTWTLVATSLGLAVVQLDVSVVNVAIKPIGASLGGGVSSLQWVVNAYTLAFAAFILSAPGSATNPGPLEVAIGAASAALGAPPHRFSSVSSRLISERGTSQTEGELPVITADLNALAQALRVTIYGISGYRTPAHSVASLHVAS